MRFASSFVSAVPIAEEVPSAGVVGLGRVGQVGHAAPTAQPSGQLGQGEPLPSVNAAQQLVDGKAGGFVAVVGTMTFRASLVGTGLVLAGEREPWEVVKKSLAASAVIETFVLLWEWAHK